MPIEYKEINGPLAERMLARQNKAIYPDLFVQHGPGKCFLPKYYSDHSDFIDNFEVRDDDLWLVSFVKAGTTWTKEMAWLIGNDLDYERAKQFAYMRFPYFEFDATWSVDMSTYKLERKNDANGATPNTMQIVQNMKSPRFIQSHLPWSMLPKQIRNGEKKPKMIYVARNPKDVCVSFYHHRVLIEGYFGSMDDHVEEFTNDLEFWERKNDPNVLFITYEELKQDLSKVVDRATEFLGKPISDEDKQVLLNHLSFESMKSNPYVNNDEVTNLLTKVHGVARQSHFIRKGKVGSWKEELSEESQQKINEWFVKNKIDGLWD
ncbi:Sulfotransferase family cytosolic 1B member 1, partial [Orchesella cincta]